MLKGPLAASEWMRPRSARLAMPVFGLSIKIQAIEASMPGMARGTSIAVQARLRNGISVRSTSQAKVVARARPTTLTTLAKMIEFMRAEYVSELVYTVA